MCLKKNFVRSLSAMCMVTVCAVSAISVTFILYCTMTSMNLQSMLHVVPRLSYTLADWTTKIVEGIHGAYTCPILLKASHLSGSASCYGGIGVSDKALDWGGFPGIGFVEDKLIMYI